MVLEKIIASVSLIRTTTAACVVDLEASACAVFSQSLAAPELLRGVGGCLPTMGCRGAGRDAEATAPAVKAGAGLGTVEVLGAGSFSDTDSLCMS